MVEIKIDQSKKIRKINSFFYQKNKKLKSKEL